ncbi:heme-binding protein [Microbacteriaceae bacterium VKM Ac-2855]|nr:heme-binding protein [Microbacteriaceae bacterium VKM Ac-2855]
MTDSDTDLLAELQRQDERLRFSVFAHRDAWAVGCRIVELATEREQSIAASIFLGEQQVFHAALPGTAADHDHWMLRKVAVVRRYDASSQLIRKRWASYGITEPHERLGLDPIAYTFSGGAVPIRIGATQVGVVVASGVTDEVEHDLVTEALEWHLAAQRG